MVRRRWILSGGLLVLAGAVTAVATWRHWQTCRRDALRSACSVLQQETEGLPLWGQVGHPDVVGTALAAVAAVLLGVAWWAVVGWARRSTARTIVAVIVGLQPLLVAALVGGVLITPGRSFLTESSGWLTWPPEILVVPFLLGAGWILEEPPVQTLRLIVLGWGVTSFGSIHQFVDYVTSGMLTSGAVAGHPGLGYVTAVTQMTLGFAVLTTSLFLPKWTGPDEGGDEWGRDGFTLVA